MGKLIHGMARRGQTPILSPFALPLVLLCGVAEPNLTVLPRICLRSDHGEIIVGWMASQTDLLSEDWLVIDGP